MGIKRKPGAGAASSCDAVVARAMASCATAPVSRAPSRAAPAPSRVAGAPLGPPTSRSLSPQQAAVIDWVRHGAGSAFVEAVAGSGKTTTLIEACRAMRGSVAFTAFNKKIADEIKYKVGDSPVRVGTFHSFGFSAWRRVAPHARVEADAKWRQMMEVCAVPWPLRSAVGRMVSIAKQSVVGLLWSPDDGDAWRRIIAHFDILLQVDETGEPESQTVDALCDCAARCIAWARSVGATVIDFDDMLWLPLVEGAPVWANVWVLVDEAQDTNPARRLLARRMLKPAGRSVWVGDRHQAIYGFTGADADAVDQIIADFGCVSLPLTVTFRCSKAATRLAQQWVPHITPHESNAEGSVTRLTAPDFAQRFIEGAESRLAPGDAILCRNTKPLVSLAFTLIRAGIGCHVEGRDIGKQLMMLATKWKVETCAALITNLEAYRQRETEKLIARDSGGCAVEALNDRIDTLLVVMEGCDTVDAVRCRIEELFRDSYDGAPSTVVLSTVHKAKGREWNRVFILGFDAYMPSRWARQAWEREQERNLMYVAATRTKTHLLLTAALEA